MLYVVHHKARVGSVVLHSHARSSLLLLQLGKKFLTDPMVAPLVPDESHIVRCLLLPMAK